MATVPAGDCADLSATMSRAEVAEYLLGEREWLLEH
jgi:hypothetical protein